MSRFRQFLCRIFGHSFSVVDLLKFKITCAGRAYSQNIVTGECTPLTSAEISCRRCGETFRKQLP